jgi:hypothetical protein
LLVVSPPVLPPDDVDRAIEPAPPAAELDAEVDDVPPDDSPLLSLPASEPPESEGALVSPPVPPAAPLELLHPQTQRPKVTASKRLLPRRPVLIAALLVQTLGK